MVRKYKVHAVNARSRINLGPTLFRTDAYTMNMKHYSMIASVEIDRILVVRHLIHITRSMKRMIPHIECLEGKKHPFFRRAIRRLSPPSLQNGQAKLN